MERWGGTSNPLVKVTSAFAVVLFLAVNFPVAFYAVVGVALSYAMALLTLAYVYRKGYGIVGIPELVVRFTAKTLVSLKQEGGRTVTRGWERHQKQKHIRREKKQKLRRYKRERNRRKREQARKAPAER